MSRTLVWRHDSSITHLMMQSRLVVEWRELVSSTLWLIWFSWFVLSVWNSSFSLCCYTAHRFMIELCTSRCFQWSSHFCRRDWWKEWNAFSLVLSRGMNSKSSERQVASKFGTGRKVMCIVSCWWDSISTGWEQWGNLGAWTCRWWKIELLEARSECIVDTIQKLRKARRGRNRQKAMW